MCGLFTSQIDIFKAMGSETRQMILEEIAQGVKRPSQISRKLGKPRSTSEKHLKILVNAGIVEKIPELNESGHLSVRYEIQTVAFTLRDALKEKRSS